MCGVRVVSMGVDKQQAAVEAALCRVMLTSAKVLSTIQIDGGSVIGAEQPSLPPCPCLVPSTSASHPWPCLP